MAESVATYSRKPACPFYLISSCRNGNKCKYTHDKLVTDSKSIICRFLLKGNCSYGNHCWYSHQKSLDDVDTDAPQLLDMELCPHFFEGVCPYPNCPCNHGELCCYCKTYCLDPYDDKRRSLHIEVCRLRTGVDSDHPKICRICLDVVLQKEVVAERIFGVLENCDHVYCFKCITKWRNQTFIPTCPVCKKLSFIHFPSGKWLNSDEEKKEFINEYMNKNGI